MVQLEGRSTVEDRRPRNFYRHVYYVFTVRAASMCHLNWTAVGDPTSVRKKTTVVSQGPDLQIILRKMLSLL